MHIYKSNQKLRLVTFGSSLVDFLNNALYSWIHNDISK